jgi:hypothetical protein
MASRWLGSWQRWSIALYDRLYRRLNGLDRPASEVGAVLRVAVRRSRRAVQLTDGTVVRRGDSVGVIHLNNERVVALHAGGLRPEAIGLEFRRQLLTSLHELARLTDLERSLTGVRAFHATTIFHHGLVRLGFAGVPGGSRGSALAGAYQRALLASLRPRGRARLDAWMRHRARQVWISRTALRARFRHHERLKKSIRGRDGRAAR